MTKPTPTEEQREAAARFYFKALNGFQQDWVDTGVVVDDVGAIDEDVVSLAALLAEREALLWRRNEEAEAALRDNQAVFCADDRLKTVLRANLATLQREHDELRRSTEAARAAIAKALGLTEWKPLADLAADVTDLGDALASARAEVARLTAEREHLGERRALRDALAASRAEVEALRAEVDYAHATVRLLQARASDADTDGIGDEMDALWDRMGKDGRDRANALAKILAEGDAALSSTPAPASAEPAPFHIDAADEAVVDALVRERAPRPTESRPLASAEPATPTTSPDCPRESPLCITKGFHAADECDVATPTTTRPSTCLPGCQLGMPGVRFGEGGGPIVVDAHAEGCSTLSLKATPTTEGGAK